MQSGRLSFCCCSVAKLCPTLCNPVAGHLYPHKLPSPSVIMPEKVARCYGILTPMSSTCGHWFKSNKPAFAMFLKKKAFGVTEVKGASRASSGSKKPNENPERGDAQGPECQAAGLFLGRRKPCPAPPPTTSSAGEGWRGGEGAGSWTEKSLLRF